MNRYDIDDCGDEILDPDGGWVKYEDHDAEIARLRAELTKAKEQVDELEWRQTMIDQTGQRIRDHAERAGFDFPDMDDEVGAMADSLIAMRAELDAAKAVIKKLPKTADGVVITDGMLLYSGSVWTARTIATTEYNGQVESTNHVDCLYSSPEAALAAKENPNAKA